MIDDAKLYDLLTQARMVEREGTQRCAHTTALLVHTDTVVRLVEDVKMLRLERDEARQEVKRLMNAILAGKFQRPPHLDREFVGYRCACGAIFDFKDVQKHMGCREKMERLKKDSPQTPEGDPKPPA